VVSRPAGVFSATSNRSTITTLCLVLPSCRHHREPLSGWSTAQPSRLLKKSASFVLASLRPSTGTRPPH